MNYEIDLQHKKLHGSIAVPPSKSHTLRAILFASLAEGMSKIENYLTSPDTTAMLHACRQLGAKIQQTEGELIIQGVNFKPKCPDDVLDAGNSGQVLRFVAAIAAALVQDYTVITGDHSIRFQRPMQPLIDGINQLGGFAAASKNDGRAPIIVRGLLSAGQAKILGTDSQPVSALLMAAAFVTGETTIEVLEPGEVPWVSLTLSWFDRLGVRYTQENFSHYKVVGPVRYQGFHYRVPGDFSSAAFPIAAALVTQSNISLENIDMQDVQGDKALIPALEKMGAEFSYDEKKQVLHVKGASALQGMPINVNDFIDAVPILATIGCYAKGKTEIVEAAIARLKESDRIKVMADELSKMGATISATADGLTVESSALKGARVYSHHDHRIAMALTIAALRAKGKTIVENTACVAKSYPNFVASLQALGAEIRVIP